MKGNRQGVLVVVTGGAALGGCCAWQERLCVLPTVLASVGVVGACRDVPVVVAQFLARLLPRMLIPHRCHLLPHRLSPPSGTVGVEGSHGHFRRFVRHSPEHQQRVGVAQPQGIQRRGIVSARISCGLCLAIHLVHPRGLDAHVQHVFLLAVVHACPLCQLALLVVSLDVLHRLYGQMLHQHVLTEHLPAVHHQFQWFAVPEQLAVLDAYARQFLDEFFQPCALLHVEGFRVEHHRVAPHVEPPLLGSHLHLLQQQR